MVPSTVRKVTFEVLRKLGMTTIFGNPGSTELPFLRDMPSDFQYVLGLHERCAAGMALGYAMATGKASFVNFALDCQCWEWTVCARGCLLLPHASSGNRGSTGSAADSRGAVPRESSSRCR
jgi:hypothetical protein